MHVLKAMYLTLDVETTGKDPNVDKVVQIGAVLSDAFGNVRKTYESLVDTEGVEIPPDASAVHHIVTEDLAGAPSLKTVLGEIEALGHYDVLVAHNAPFDMGFIKPPSHIPVVDTLRMAQHLWPELDQHKNQYLRYFFKLRVEGGGKQMTHSALPDALVTAANLVHELATAMQIAKDPDNLTVDKLTAWIANPVKVLKLRFGKHKGKMLLDLARTEPGYLRWMLEKMEDLDDDLRHSILWAQDTVRREREAVSSV
jgi:exodeoxyribonuclease X